MINIAVILLCISFGLQLYIIYLLSKRITSLERNRERLTPWFREVDRRLTLVDNSMNELYRRRSEKIYP